MRKRFVTTLLICLFTVTCVFGFAACGDNNVEVPKGEQVTEEQWKDTIKATIDLTNCTINTTVNASSVDQYQNDEGKYIAFTRFENMSDVVYISNNTANRKCTLRTKTTGSGNEVDREWEDIHESYVIINGKDVYESYIDTEKFIIGAPENYVEREAKWRAGKVNTGIYLETIQDVFMYCIFDTGHPLDFKFATVENNTEVKSLADLYSEFTYSNGKYSARLFLYDILYNIEVSIQGGYVLGYKMNSVKEESAEDSIEYRECICIFKDFGKTTVNAPAGAVEAINKIR